MKKVKSVSAKSTAPKTSTTKTLFPNADDGQLSKDGTRVGVVEVQYPGGGVRRLERDYIGNYWVGKRRVSLTEALGWYMENEYGGSGNGAYYWSCREMLRFLKECASIMVEDNSTVTLRGRNIEVRGQLAERVKRVAKQVDAAPESILLEAIEQGCAKLLGKGGAL